MPPPGMPPPGAPPFAPGSIRPPFPPPPSFVPAGSASPFPPVTPGQSGIPSQPSAGPPVTAAAPPPLILPNPALEQKYAPFKKPTDLKYADPNFSPVSLSNFPIAPNQLAVYRKRGEPVLKNTILLKIRRIFYHLASTLLRLRRREGRKGHEQRTSSSGQDCITLRCA
jgi:hypothetical protein